MTNTSPQQFHFAQTDPGLIWKKEHRVVVDADGFLDNFWVLTPNVVRIPDGGYRLYYTGVSRERRAQNCLGYILSAVSEDGLHWQKEVGIRLDTMSSAGEVWVYCPDVIPLPDGRWRMYFQVKSDSGWDQILSAVSADGILWTREEGARFFSDTHDCGSPRCLILKDGRYRLYFHFSNSHERHILSAISKDGLCFEREGEFCITRETEFESHTVYAPEVLRLGTGGYRMYYAAWSETPRHGRILSAFSEDGLIWKKAGVVCVDIGGVGQEIKVSEPCVMTLPDGSFCMLYEACDAQGKWRIFSVIKK